MPVGLVWGAGGSGGARARLGGRVVNKAEVCVPPLCAMPVAWAAARGESCVAAAFQFTRSAIIWCSFC